MSLIKTFTIPKISDDCFLFFAEHPRHIPFQIQRVYYITKARKNIPRGFHAHHKTRQLLFCVQGSITLVFDDGMTREKIRLCNPETGILIDKLIWHEMHRFNNNTILLILASAPYDEADYIRDYNDFLKVTHDKG